VDAIKNEVVEMKMTVVEMEETQEMMVADMQRKAHKIYHLELLVQA